MNYYCYFYIHSYIRKQTKISPKSGLLTWYFVVSSQFRYRILHGNLWSERADGWHTFSCVILWQVQWPLARNGLPCVVVHCGRCPSVPVVTVTLRTRHVGVPHQTCLPSGDQSAVFSDEPELGALCALLGTDTQTGFVLWLNSSEPIFLLTSLAVAAVCAQSNLDTANASYSHYRTWKVDDFLHLESFLQRHLLS